MSILDVWKELVADTLHHRSWNVKGLIPGSRGGEDEPLLKELLVGAPCRKSAHPSGSYKASAH